MDNNHFDSADADPVAYNLSPGTSSTDSFQEPSPFVGKPKDKGNRRSPCGEASTLVEVRKRGSLPSTSSHHSFQQTCSSSGTSRHEGMQGSSSDKQFTLGEVRKPDRSCRADSTDSFLYRQTKFNRYRFPTGELATCGRYSEPHPWREALDSFTNNGSCFSASMPSTSTCSGHLSTSGSVSPSRNIKVPIEKPNRWKYKGYRECVRAGSYPYDNRRNQKGDNRTRRSRTQRYGRPDRTSRAYHPQNCSAPPSTHGNVQRHRRSEASTPMLSCHPASRPPLSRRRQRFHEWSEENVERLTKPRRKRNRNQPSPRNLSRLVLPGKQNRIFYLHGESSEDHPYVTITYHNKGRQVNKNTLNYRNQPDRPEVDGVCYIERLPEEMVLKVASYLEGRDLLACCCVNKNWSTYFHNIRVWEKVVNRRNLRAELEDQKCRSIFLFPEPTLDSSISNLQLMYAAHQKRANNWNIGRYKQIHCMTGMFCRCIDSDGQLIVAAGMKAEWELWHITKESTRCVYCHCCNREVETVKLVGDLIFIKCRGLINVFQIRTDVLRDHLNEGPEHPVPTQSLVYLRYTKTFAEDSSRDRNFAIGNGFMVMPDRRNERKIQVWKMRTGAAVRSLALPDGMRLDSTEMVVVKMHLYAAFSDIEKRGVVLGWRLKGGELFMRTVAHSTAIEKMIVTTDRTDIYTADGEGNFTSVCAVTGTVKSKVPVDQVALPYFSVSRDNRLVALCKSPTVISVCEFQTGNVVCTVQHAPQPKGNFVTFVHIEGDVLLTCGIVDGRVWSIKTGHLLYVITWPPNMALFCRHQFWISQGKLMLGSQGLLVLDFS